MRSMIYTGGHLFNTRAVLSAGGLLIPERTVYTFGIQCKIHSWIAVAGKAKDATGQMSVYVKTYSPVRAAVNTGAWQRAILVGGSLLSWFCILGQLQHQIQADAEFASLTGEQEALH